MYVKTDFGKWVDEDEQDGEPVKPEEDMDPMGGMGGMGGMPGMGGMGGMDLEQVCLVLQPLDSYTYGGSTDDGADGRRRRPRRCWTIRG